MDFDKQYHISSTYSFDLIVTGNDRVRIVGYDSKERDYYETGRVLEKIVACLITDNPFGKRRLQLNVGYSSDKVSDRGFLPHLIDCLIFRYSTANIKISRGVTSLNIKG